jgi:hypothetical protein
MSMWSSIKSFCRGTTTIDGRPATPEEEVILDKGFEAMDEGFSHMDKAFQRMDEAFSKLGKTQKRKSDGGPLAITAVDGDVTISGKVTSLTINGKVYRIPEE